MGKPSIAPADDIVYSYILGLEKYESARLDQLYCKVWQLLDVIDDEYSAQADRYWAFVFAIEDVRQYLRGMVKDIRNHTSEQRQ